MKAIEDQITELLTAEEARTPPASAAMQGIRRGVARRRRRRVAGVAGVAVAAAAAITVPVMLHGSPEPRPAPTSAAAPAHHKSASISLTTIFAPTWLPSGVVETGRGGQLRSHPGFPATTTRSFAAVTASNKGLVGVSDERAARAVPKTAEPVRVAGRSGVGWVTHDPAGYEIQVKWRTGHWLDLNVGGVHSPKTTALRIANSITERPAAVALPLTCAGPRCSDLNILIVSGSWTDKDWYAQAIGKSITLELDHSRNHAAGSAVMPLGGGLYGHVIPAVGAKNPPSKAEIAKIGKTMRLVEPPDYSWLGGRP